MRKIAIGVLGAADIAYKRFLPSLTQFPNEIMFAGIASRSQERARMFQSTFGGTIYSNYEAILNDAAIGAVYIPLPPALHFQWAKQALEKGKHVLLEKPSTNSYRDTNELVALAKKKNLTLFENYMFINHTQLHAIKRAIAQGEIGQLRLIRTAFGFPKRAADDFRYQAALGGGAILDCGGYPVRLARELLGESACVEASILYRPEGYDIDLYGNATLKNADGLVAQIAFGMDNHYKCELEIWGSKGSIYASRIFTAPPGFAAPVQFQTPGGTRTEEFEHDQCLSMINSFYQSIQSKTTREKAYEDLLMQMTCVEAIIRGVII